MKVEFVEANGGYTGMGNHGREWRVTRVTTGWLLQLRDEHDTLPTNAGIYSSLEAAQSEAGRTG